MAKTWIQIISRSTLVKFSVAQKKIIPISSLRTDNNGALAHQRGRWRTETRLGADSSLHQKPAIYHFLTMKEGRWTFGTSGHQTLVQSVSQHTCQLQGGFICSTSPLRCSFSRAGFEMYDCFIVFYKTGPETF